MSYVNQLLGENEEVVLVSRQSWVVLLRDAVVNLTIVVIIAAVAMIVFGMTRDSLSFLVTVLLVLPFGRFVWQVIRWKNREYIVTNRRVIQVEGTINKNVMDSSLEKVNDVRMSQSILGRMLNYGDVEILTASEMGSNLFRRIGSPIKFKTVMLNEKEKLGFAENAAPAPVPAPAAPPPQPLDAPILLAQLNAMRKEGLITDEEYQKKKADILARM